MHTLRMLDLPASSQVFEGAGVFMLNPMGVMVYERLAEGKPPQQIAQELAHAFNVGEEVAMQDVAEFLGHLGCLGMLPEPTRWAELG